MRVTKKKVSYRFPNQKPIYLSLGCIQVFFRESDSGLRVNQRAVLQIRRPNAVWGMDHSCGNLALKLGVTGGGMWKGIYSTYIFYHKKQPNMSEYISSMDAMGLIKLLF